MERRCYILIITASVTAFWAVICTIFKLLLHTSWFCVAIPTVIIFIMVLPIIAATTLSGEREGR